jgi:putative aminopeptidase FrvX
MTTSEFCKIAGRLMRRPAAPYHEHAVRTEVEKICTEHGLPFERDVSGNVLVRWQTSRKSRPLALAAHLDHPGFAIPNFKSQTSKTGQRSQAQFLGGVPNNYFRRGTRLRLMPGGEPASLGKRIGKQKEFELRVDRSPKSLPEFAVWELEDFAVRRGRIHGRACDDLIGVASILATLIELKRTRARVNVIGMISRAEEIGFLGALAVAAGKKVPKRSLVISLETSRELPGAVMGNGVILRVGDRTSIFDSEATRFLSEVANARMIANSKFRFQRALMNGGTCEATAYQEFGFQTAAVCVALGNYHNCGPANKIRAEYVSVADALGMVNLLVSAARQMPRYSKLVGKLPARLNELLRRAIKRLQVTKKAEGRR